MADRDPFYVGYLPLPASIKRFILPWVVGSVVLAIAVGIAIASQHSEPGDGVWDTGQVVTIEGVLTVDPYPLLRVENEDGTVRTCILVEQGKLGVQQRIEDESIEEGGVMATGFLIERDGRTVLELDGTDPNALVQLDEVYAILPAPEGPDPVYAGRIA